MINFTSCIQEIGLKSLDRTRYGTTCYFSNQASDDITLFIHSHLWLYFIPPLRTFC